MHRLKGDFMSDINQKRYFFFKMELFLKGTLGETIVIDKMRQYASLNGKIRVESSIDASQADEIEFSIAFNDLGALRLCMGTHSGVDIHDKVNALNILNNALMNYKPGARRLSGADAFYVIRCEEQEFPVMEWVKGENKWAYLRDLCGRAELEDTFIEDVMILNMRTGLEPIENVQLVKKREL